MSSKTIISKGLKSLLDDLVKAYDTKGMRASGNFEKELEVKATETNGVLYGANYTQQLETGQEAGGVNGQSFSELSSDIDKWVDDKQISSRINGEITKNQLVFLITRKIWREGWNRKGYGGIDLISEVVTDERLQSIIDEVGDYYMVTVSTEIVKLIKELA